jgi:hypothetical protein
VTVGEEAAESLAVFATVPVPGSKVPVAVALRPACASVNGDSRSIFPFPYPERKKKIASVQAGRFRIIGFSRR